MITDSLFPRTGRGLLGALVLAGCALAQPAARAADAPATLYYDGQIFTADPAHPYADAIAIRGERILAVGPLAAVQEAAGSDARKVDLKGRFLMPGMIDAHAHPLSKGVGGGMTLIQPSFPAEGGDVAKLVAFVSEAIKAKKPTSFQGEVLVVRNLDLGYWAKAAEIDAAFSQGELAGTPILLAGGDGHTGWGNRKLRERAGITTAYVKGLKDSERRFYGTDAAGRPNGFVVDVGLEKLIKAVPLPSAQTMLEAGKAAVRYMNGLGITAWTDAAVSGAIASTSPATAGDTGGLPVYKALAEQGLLNGHVVAYPVVSPNAGLGQIDVVQSLQKQFAGIPDLRIIGMKVFADGVAEIPSQTAAFTHPYKNTGRQVLPLFEPEKMNALVTEAYRRGLTVHVHAIGDLAVKDTLDAFEAARKANPGTKLPMVITHVQFADPQDIPRFASLHVIAALQLLWAGANEDSIEDIKPYIDPSIFPWQYPARSILDAGGEIAGASDWPVSSANPFAAIAIAETRQGDEGVLDAGQRMPREAMLYAYTSHAADALNWADEIGTLEPGKRADLTLIDRDILTVPVQELRKAKVVFTLFNGKLVYGKEP